MGYIRTIREAVVAHLKSDAALSAYLEHGTFYDFARTAKHPLSLTRSDCPALVVGPSAVPRRPSTNRTADVTVTLTLSLVVDSPDAGEAEDFFNLVEAALDDGAPDFGLEGAAAPFDAAFGGAHVETLFDEAESITRGVMWRLEFDYSLSIRRTVR